MMILLTLLYRKRYLHGQSTPPQGRHDRGAQAV
ncbi:hypothetical protein P308_00520 [Pseudomonas piscis]|nr:hypothetical protein P308_00520 [Pseudomonas piscis]